MTGIAPRVAVAAVAVVLLGWLGVMERDYRLFVGVAGAPSTSRVDSDLRAARFLNPDSGPDLIRAVRVQSARDWRAAEGTIERVLRDEPDNLYAWNALAFVARGHDPLALRRAQAAARRLDPRPFGPR